MRRLIDQMVLLPDREWHKITMKMAWHFRTGGIHIVPSVVLAGFEGVTPSQEDWDTVRTTTNAARKADKMSAQRYERLQKKERRRIYMREYMAKRRANGR